MGHFKDMVIQYSELVSNILSLEDMLERYSKEIGKLAGYYINGQEVNDIANNYVKLELEMRKVHTEWKAAFRKYLQLRRDGTLRSDKAIRDDLSILTKKRMTGKIDFYQYNRERRRLDLEIDKLDGII